MPAHLDGLDIPPFLRLTPEERARAWRDNPPHGVTVNPSGPAPLQVMQKQVQRAKAKGSKAKRIALSQDQLAVKAGKTWNPRQGRWI